MRNRIIAFILALTCLFMCTIPAFADESVETFLSEVSLVYADSLEEAKEAIAGTDWKIFENDLNVEEDNETDDGVYLIYKTTTDVEEAITDLRVMDMYGGYDAANYQRQLEESRDGYEALIKDLTGAIDEFKTLYNEGNEMAKIAYKQLNYYKDTKVSATSDETNMLMGDFLLNVPSTKAFVQVLMEGNTLVVGNILTLLALGISGSSTSSIKTRVAEQYKNAANLTDEMYYDTASSLYDSLKELRKKVIEFDELKDTIDPNSEEVTEEDYNFYTNLLPIVSALEEIKLGEKSLCDLVRDGTYSKKDLYPVAAAFTKGQMSLVNAGLIEIVLKYASPKAITQDTYDKLDELDEELKDENGVIQPIDVYIGVDRTIFEGAFAMTNAANRTEALSGQSWAAQNPENQANAFHRIAISLFFIDAIVTATYLTYSAVSFIFFKLWLSGKAAAGIYTTNSFMATLLKVTTKYIYPNISIVLFVALGVALIAAGIVMIGEWYGYYNPNYTEIPDIMIDVRDSDFGDRYVKYTAAKVYGDEDGRNADFNAYEGKEWIALYYTKDATAGNSLTPNFKFSNDSDKVTRRHQGISMFGESSAFNLNSHVYDAHAPKIFLSVRYSNTKKAAAAEIPEVVGSMLSQSAIYAITAVAGVAAGTGGTVTTIFILNKIKSKKQKNETPENN